MRFPSTSRHSLPNAGLENHSDSWSTFERNQWQLMIASALNEIKRLVEVEEVDALLKNRPEVLNIFERYHKQLELANHLDEIKHLLEELENLPGVEEASALLRKPDDLHNIIFQIKPEVPEINEDEEVYNRADNGDFENFNVMDIWKNAQSLVLQTCNKLRKSTGEKWYFRTQLVEYFGIDQDF